MGASTASSAQPTTRPMSRPMTADRAASRFAEPRLLGRPRTAARPSPHLDLCAQCLPPRRARPLHRRRATRSAELYGVDPRRCCWAPAPWRSSARSSRRPWRRSSTSVRALGHCRPAVALRSRHSARAVRGAGRRTSDMRHVLRERLETPGLRLPVSTTTTSPGRPSAARYAAKGGAAAALSAARDISTRSAARVDRVEVLNRSITEYLAGAADASRDALRAARRAGLDDRCTAQRAVARDHPHGAARRAGDLPHRRPSRRCCPAACDALLGRWRYEAAQSQALTARDRSAIYGGFHLYVFEG